MSYRPNINTRLQDLLDGIRNEFENVKTEASAYRLHKDESDHKFNQQTNELQKIKQTVFELENAHRSIKDAYEQEIIRLKLELEQRDRQLVQQQHERTPSQHPVSLATAPAPGAPAAPGHPPTAQQQQQQQPQPQPQQVPYGQKSFYNHLPQSLAQQPALPQPAGANQLPPPPPQLAPGNNPSSNGIPTPKNQPQQLPPVQANGTPQQNSLLTPKQNPIQPQQQHGLPPPPPPNQYQQNGPQPIGPPQRTASGQQHPPPPGPGAPYPPSQQHTPQPARGELAPVPGAAPGSSGAPGGPGAAPGQVAVVGGSGSGSGSVPPPPSGAAPGQEVARLDSNAYTVPGNQRSAHKKLIPQFLKELDAQLVPADLKKQMSDYYVLYNPALPRKIDVDLVHSLDHNSVVCCVRFSADGKFLATGCNKTTQVYSVETGELVARLLDNNVPQNNGNGANVAPEANNGGDLYIRSVCFSPDGKYLATGAEDKLIRIWDLTTRRITKYLKGHEQDIYSLDFFPDGRKLISGSGDRTVRIWDLTSGLTQLTLTIEDGVTTVAVSPDGKLIAAGSLDRTVRVWDAITGFLVERLDSENENDNGHKDSVYSVIFTSNGKEIASGSLDNTVKLWSLNGLSAPNSNSNTPANCEVTYVGHKDFVLSVCASPNGEYILSGSKDRGVIFWEKNTGDPVLMLQGHRNSVISVSVSNSPINSSGMFATGSGDCKARIWKWSEY